MYLTVIIRLPRVSAIGLSAALVAMCLPWAAAAGLGPGAQAARDAGIILARPPFTRDRRPPPGPKGSAAAETDTLPRLSGIIVAASYRRAIFAGSPHPAAYREGDRIGRYIISVIGNQRVTLDGPDGRHAIGVTFDSSRPAGTGAPAVPFAPSIIDRLNSHFPYRPTMPKMPTPEEFEARMAQPPK